jgi:hypothetical protein
MEIRAFSPRISRENCPAIEKTVPLQRTAVMDGAGAMQPATASRGSRDRRQAAAIVKNNRIAPTTNNRGYGPVEKRLALWVLPGAIPQFQFSE